MDFDDASAPVPGDMPDAEAREPDEAELWQRCKAGDDDARARLLEMHMPYARTVAASFYARRMHDEIEFGEYLQLASLGLVECVDRFDAQLGVRFRTFAARRMQGALLDGLERMTEKQQQIAARKRLELQRVEAVKEGLGVTGAKGQRSAEQLLAHVADAGLAFALAWLLDGTGMLHAEDRTEAVPFYRSVELRQLRERILELVHTLPPQERRVVREHYFQERQFQDIARDMGLTKGRISQVHHRALGRLREALAPRGDCDVAW